MHYNTKTYFIFVVLAVVAGTAVALTCGGDECGNPTDDCCYNSGVSAYACYNPTLYSCVSGDNGTVLCGSGAATCVFTCYDPTSYVCCNEQLQDISVGCADSSTPAPTPTPTSAPTTPAPTGCTDSSCGVGLSCCAAAGGIACYDPANYTCEQNSTGAYILCGNVLWDQHRTYPCGESCIDPTQYLCCHADGDFVFQKSIYNACPTPAPPPTPTPSPAPTPAYTQEINATHFYEYYETTGQGGDRSSVSEISVAFPVPVSWHANKVLTVDVGLVAIFDGDFTNVQASVEVEWTTSNGASLVITSTSCTDATYAACDITFVSPPYTTCYPPTAAGYYDIRICPCQSCQFLASQTFAPVNVPSFLNVGVVSAPLSLSFVPLTPTQENLDISITKLTLHYVNT